MSRILSFLASIVMPLAATAATLGCSREATATPVIGAYYPGYAASRYPITRIPADRLTHLFYAFAKIHEGQCATDPAADLHFYELAQLKRQYPHLQALISIGGWDAGGFSDAALTKESRELFVSSCLAMFFDHPQATFDGVDLDWEFPVSGGPPTITARPEDRRNMTLLAQEFRRRLDALGKARGRKLLLTAALPAGRLQFGGPYDPAKSFELKALAHTLDFINLMTYDMGPGVLRVTGPNAPLREDPGTPLPPPLRRANTVEGAIDDYVRQGVPPEKLVLGVPFYGRGARVKTDAGNGLHQPVDAPFEAGDWRTIRTTLLPDSRWRRYWNANAQSPWLYEPRERLFVSYEDPRSIGIRAKLARERGLRGVFMWEVTGDDDDHSLLQAMRQPFAR